VLVKAHRRWRRIEAPDRYVRRAILHEYLSWRRRRSSHETVVEELPETAASGAYGGDPAGPQADRDAVRAALAGLPRRQRAVLVLRYYEDLDDSEIAELLVQLDHDRILRVSGPSSALNERDILAIAADLTLSGR
jgi:DNA-directed RNA polymerase specialized sigma24 family protein